MAALGVTLAVTAPALADLSVKAYVDQTVVSLDQSFTLFVELSGSDANRAPDPELPDLGSFAAFVGRSTSQNIQIINGRMSVTRTISYQFIAREAGSFEIPAVQLTFMGKVYRTDPIKIVVRKQPATRARPPGQRGQQGRSTAEVPADNLFLKVTPSKRRVYQNEPVVLTYEIWTKVNVTSYGISRLPNYAGFWSEEFEMPQRPPTRTEVVGGQQFLVAEIKRVALFPQSAGEKMIEPMEVECEVRVASRRRSRDIFDSFFDDPFFARTVRRGLRSKPVKIEVLPLPKAGQPDGFAGAVGEYRLSASVDRNQVTTSEAVTLKVTISGRGNIRMLPYPKVDIPPDFEVYDPKVTESIRRRQGVISGSKTFEFVLIPRAPGNQVIKPVTYSFFNPKTRSYETLRSPAFEIRVSKGAEEYVTAGSGLSKREVKLVGQDIRFIRTELPRFRRIGSEFYRQSLFLLGVVLPLLGLIAAVGYRRHLDKLSSNVAYARSRRANQTAMKRLRHAKQSMKERDSKRFYSEVAKALIGYLGDKFNREDKVLTSEEIESLLRSRGINGELVQEVIDCLSTCDFRRFAPTEEDDREMDAFYEKARQTIVELERVI
jgi:hypothetical protein